MIPDQIKRHLSFNQDDFYRQLVLSCKSQLPYIQPSEYPVVLFQPAATSHKAQLKSKSRNRQKEACCHFNGCSCQKGKSVEKIVALYVYQEAGKEKRSYKITYIFFFTLSSCSCLNFLLGVYSVRFQHYHKTFLSLGSKEKLFDGRETRFAFSKDV